nr:hypothetical protein [Paracoccus mutanolyticus]
MPRITMRLRPRHGYGEHPARVVRRGSNHVRYELGPEELRLTTTAPIEFVLNETPFLLDRPQVFLLGPNEPLSDYCLLSIPRGWAARGGRRGARRSEHGPLSWSRRGPMHAGRWISSMTSSIAGEDSGC